MTEKLEKEARFRTKGWKEQENCVQAYIAGAEPREKRIEELEAQIEKMKCCRNCVHFDLNEPNYCHKGVYRERQYVCGKWCFGN